MGLRRSLRLLRTIRESSANLSRPDWERAHLASRAFASEGDWERAVMWGRMAARENPQAADVWNDLGFALNGLAQARWNAAPLWPLLHQPTAPAPQPLAPVGDAGAKAAIARADAVVTWQEAADALSRALSINPRFAEAHNNLGIALLKCDRYDESRDAFAKALELKPDYGNAKANLAFVENQIANLSAPD